jgi:ABC-type transport system involved in cytochrome c biogenesis ATPase subunit
MTAGTTSVEQVLARLPESPAVWCSGLRKRYGRQTAVDGVSFTVGRGEVVGLLGPNGAGKTSVIKMLLGLVRPDAGEVLLLGRPASDPRSRALVGYLPELFRYQPWLTAAEVLGLHVRLAGVTATPEQQRECLELVGLGARTGDRVGGFSKGMQQRLGMAVALVARPSSSSSTSRPARSTRSGGPTCATCCCRSRSAGSPSCSTPTSSGRWSGSATGSSSSTGGRSPPPAPSPSCSAGASCDSG